MPLLPGKENVGHNIKVEQEHGKPHDQAVAIAMKTAGLSRKGEGEDKSETLAQFMERIRGG